MTQPGIDTLGSFSSPKQEELSLAIKFKGNTAQNKKISELKINDVVFYGKTSGEKVNIFNKIGKDSECRSLVKRFLYVLDCSLNNPMLRAKFSKNHQGTKATDIIREAKEVRKIKLKTSSENFKMKFYAQSNDCLVFKGKSSDAATFFQKCFKDARQLGLIRKKSEQAKKNRREVKKLNLRKSFTDDHQTSLENSLTEIEKACKTADKAELKFLSGVDLFAGLVDTYPAGAGSLFGKVSTGASGILNIAKGVSYIGMSTAGLASQVQKARAAEDGALKSFFIKPWTKSFEAYKTLFTKLGIGEIKNADERTAAYILLTIVFLLPILISCPFVFIYNVIKYSIAETGRKVGLDDQLKTFKHIFYLLSGIVILAFAVLFILSFAGVPGLAGVSSILNIFVYGYVLANLCAAIGCVRMVVYIRRGKKFRSEFFKNLELTLGNEELTDEQKVEGFLNYLKELVSIDVKKEILEIVSRKQGKWRNKENFSQEDMQKKILKRLKRKLRLKVDRLSAVLGDDAQNILKNVDTWIGQLKNPEDIHGVKMQLQELATNMDDNSFKILIENIGYFLVYFIMLTVGNVIATWGSQKANITFWGVFISAAFGILDEPLDIFKYKSTKGFMDKLKDKMSPKKLMTKAIKSLNDALCGYPLQKNLKWLKESIDQEEKRETQEGSESSDEEQELMDLFRSEATGQVVQDSEDDEEEEGEEELEVQVE